MPPLGVVYGLRSGAAGSVTDKPAGAGVTWDHSNVSTNLLIDYATYDVNLLPKNIRDSVPTAAFCYQQQGAPTPDKAAYDFFSDNETHLIKVGTKTSGNNATERRKDTIMAWGHQYNTTIYYNGFYRWYAGYGTLKVQGKTYENVVMIKSYNAALTADTVVQFHHFSPFYHLIMSYVKSAGSTKNVLVFDLTKEGNNGIEENSALNNMELYPVPVSTELNIRNVEDALEINVYGFNGQLLKSTPVIKGEEIQHISVEGLASGMYILEAGNKRQKFLIKE